jgi:hypothetical protein
VLHEAHPAVGGDFDRDGRDVAEADLVDQHQLGPPTPEHLRELVRSLEELAVGSLRGRIECQPRIVPGVGLARVVSKPAASSGGA